VPENRSPQPFSATAAEINGESVVTLTGELDMATAPDLAAVLDSVVKGGPGDVIIDLSALSFIDSSGIAVLVTGQQELIQQERRLSLRGARPHPMKVFEIAGLVELLNVEIEPEESPSR
jgi:anti-sigma B factor antagonist